MDRKRTLLICVVLTEMQKGNNKLIATIRSRFENNFIVRVHLFCAFCVHNTVYGQTVVDVPRKGDNISLLRLFVAPLRTCND